MQLPQGAISWYHFFADAAGDNIMVVVEKTANVFTNMYWGTSLLKLGSWTGGPYFGGAVQGYYLATSPTSDSPGFLQSARCPGCFSAGSPFTFVRVDVDSFTGKWVGMDNTTNGYSGYTGKIGASCVCDSPTNSLAPSYIKYIDRLTYVMTGQSLLLPIRLLVSRDAGGMSFIGSIPNVFASNACVKGFTPATLYNWGPDQYRIFPGPSSNPGLGFAVKQV
jgi:hypothetical protein